MSTGEEEHPQGWGVRTVRLSFLQRDLIEKLCTLPPYLNIDHCMPKPTEMIRLIITESIANLPSVKNTMIKIWDPQPSMIERSMPFFGGRKTSPWTNFQPNSSCASSFTNTQINEKYKFINPANYQQTDIPSEFNNIALYIKLTKDRSNWATVTTFFPMQAYKQFFCLGRIIINKFSDQVTIWVDGPNNGCYMSIALKIAQQPEKDFFCSSNLTFFIKICS